MELQNAAYAGNDVSSNYANRKTGEYCVQWDFRFNGKTKQDLSVIKSRMDKRILI